MQCCPVCTVFSRFKPNRTGVAYNEARKHAKTMTADTFENRHKISIFDMNSHFFFGRTIKKAYLCILPYWIRHTATNGLNLATKAPLYGKEDWKKTAVSAVAADLKDLTQVVYFKKEGARIFVYTQTADGASKTYIGSDEAANQTWAMSAKTLTGDERPTTTDGTNKQGYLKEILPVGNTGNVFFHFVRANGNNINGDNTYLIANRANRVGTAVYDDGHKTDKQYVVVNREGGILKWSNNAEPAVSEYVTTSIGSEHLMKFSAATISASGTTYNGYYLSPVSNSSQFLQLQRNRFSTDSNKQLAANKARWRSSVDADRSNNNLGKGQV